MHLAQAFNAAKLVGPITPNINKQFSYFELRFAPRNQHVHIYQNGVQNVRAYRVPRGSMQSANFSLEREAQALQEAACISTEHKGRDLHAIQDEKARGEYGQK